MCWPPHGQSWTFSTTYILQIIEDAGFLELKLVLYSHMRLSVDIDSHFLILRSETNVICIYKIPFKVH